MSQLEVDLDAISRFPFGTVWDYPIFPVSATMAGVAREGRSQCLLCLLLSGLIRHGFTISREMLGDTPHADDSRDRQDREI